MTFFRARLRNACKAIPYAGRTTAPSGGQTSLGTQR
jgi:hypothetical protein